MRRTVNDEVEQRMLYHYTVYERIKESKNLRECAREEGSKRKRDCERKGGMLKKS